MFSIILLTIGAVFTLLGAIGVIRMPDVYMRISVSTKSATLGVGAILVAVAVQFDSLAVSAKLVATIVFLLLTAPVAAHMIGRAAYAAGARQWHGCIADDLAEHTSSADSATSSDDL